MAFLEVITRTYQRPYMLSKNQASLEMQTDNDWIQTIYPDYEGRGVAWANGQMFHIAQQLTGDYVWILDDDDMCILDNFVAELKNIAAQDKPDVIMIRMDHGERGVLPPPGDEFPRMGAIGCSAYVVKRNIWERHAYQWQSAHYGSDYDFIHSIFRDEAVKVYWYNVIASKVQRISLGEPE